MQQIDGKLESVLQDLDEVQAYLLVHRCAEEGQGSRGLAPAKESLVEQVNARFSHLWNAFGFCGLVATDYLAPLLLFVCAVQTCS